MKHNKAIKNRGLVSQQKKVGGGEGDFLFFKTQNMAFLIMHTLNGLKLCYCIRIRVTWRTVKCLEFRPKLYTSAGIS